MGRQVVGGADRFVHPQHGSNPEASDLIRDFSRSQGDRADLALADANKLADGDQAFTLQAAARIFDLMYSDEDEIVMAGGR